MIHLFWSVVMKKTSVWIGVLLFVVASQFAYANHHESGDAKHGDKCEGMTQGDFGISGLDANKDGAITKEEYLSGDKNNTEKTFKHIDANSDGKLDAPEQKEIEAVYKEIHQKYKAKTTTM